MGWEHTLDTDACHAKEPKEGRRLETFKELRTLAVGTVSSLEEEACLDFIRDFRFVSSPERLMV